MLRFTLLCLVPALLVTGAPSGIHHGPDCQTTYDTVYTKDCHTTYDKKCNTLSKTKYKTEYDTKCETVHFKNCFPVPRKEPDQECHTVYDEVCTKNTQQSYDTRYDEKCDYIQKQVCEETHVSPAPSYGGGHAQVQGGSYGYTNNYGRYGRSADPKPSGYGPKCHYVKDKVCNKVAVQVPVYVEVPLCKKIPSTVCNPTYKTVLDTKCVDIPKEQCTQVPRQAHYQVPFEVCEDIPIENCVDVPKKVPKKICKSYGVGHH